MSYRCQLCKSAVPARRALLRHTIYREVPTLGQTSKQIAREIPVCGSCHGAIADGATVESLTHRPEPISPSFEGEDILEDSN